MGWSLDTLKLKDAPEIEVRLRRSAAARRMSLRVSQLDGSVTLTVPRRLPLRQAQAFVQERSDWLREATGAAQSPEPIAFGTSVPIEGALKTVVPAPGKRVSIENGTLAVPQATSTPGRVIASFLKRAARVRLQAACDAYSAQLGRPYGRLTLRDTRSRWGSCTSDGNLMFSWRLIMAPPEVLDYVAAHEVAHLQEMNHSAAFWTVVAQLCPDYQAHRDWLRTEGASLHKWRFDD